MYITLVELLKESSFNIIPTACNYGFTFGCNRRGKDQTVIVVCICGGRVERSFHGIGISAEFRISVTVYMI